MKRILIQSRYIKFLKEILKNYKSKKIVRKSSNNLIIVNQFFPPDFASTGQLIEELTKAFRNEEFSIKILTGMPAYYFNTKYAKSIEKKNNIVIIRSRLSRIISKKLKGKIFNSILFCIRVFSHILFINKNNSLILYTSEPAYLPIFAWIFFKFKKIPYIILIYDIYPEILKGLQILSEDNWIFKFWKKFNKFTFDEAREIIVLSKGMQNKIINNYSVPKEKINIIPSWADPQLIYPIPRENNSFLKDNNLLNSFIILYSGNQGRCHDLETLINTAKILKENKNIIFLFVGDGYQNKSLRREASVNKLTNCMFLPFQEKKDLPLILSSASIGIVSLHKHINGLIAPSKLYGHLASGTPIALISNKNSYLKDLIEEKKFGRWFNNGDQNKLAKWIIEIYHNKNIHNDISNKSLKFFFDEYTLSQNSQKYLEVINRNF